jgi:hypothetical protein
VVDTEVLDWDAQGRGKRVRLFIDAKVRKVDYTLDYRYDEPTRIEWDFVEGNGINDADGHYLFEDLGDGGTRATYRFGLEVGIPLPGPVARRAHRSTLRASVEDLKREAERRAASATQAVIEEPAATVPAGEPASEREAALAEKAGIKPPPPPAPPPLPDETTQWGNEDGAHSVAELPGLIIGRTASLGRRVAEGGVETAREVTMGAAGAGVGAARRAVRLGLRVPRAVANRAARNRP